MGCIICDSILHCRKVIDRKNFGSDEEYLEERERIINEICYAIAFYHSDKFPELKRLYLKHKRDNRKFMKMQDGDKERRERE